MKKIIIFIGIVVIVIVATISYMYLNYKAEYEMAKKENAQFESYYNQEIYGADLATLINKATDKNIKNEIQKDSKGNYIQDGKSTLRIDIKFLDDDKMHTMEEIYRGNIDIFINYYNQIKFKCTKIEYYDINHNIKYMLFEQITQ